MATLVEVVTGMEETLLVVTGMAATVTVVEMEEMATVTKAMATAMLRLRRPKLLTQLPTLDQTMLQMGLAVFHQAFHLHHPQTQILKLELGMERTVEDSAVVVKGRVELL